jgi:hypothetical protein
MRRATWLAATSLTLLALAACGADASAEPGAVRPEDTVAPLDGDTSAETTQDTTSPEEAATSEEMTTAEASVTSDDMTDAEKVILDKYGIDHEAAGKAFEEILGAAWASAGADEEMSEEQMRDILDKYDIDADDFYKAYGEMISAESGKMSPDAPATEDEPDANAAEAQPLDGGEYTWPNGVHMALSVVQVEPWGETDDYCGDGSCGVSNPDDLRWVLRYDVTVPDSFSGPFDAYSCPGNLHIVNGNDDEAFNLVAGENYSSIDGDILPGASKYGQAEYSIERAVLGSEFYIESSCGNTDFIGDTVLFRGTINA